MLSHKTGTVKLTLITGGRPSADVSFGSADSGTEFGGVTLTVVGPAFCDEEEEFRVERTLEEPQPVTSAVDATANKITVRRDFTGCL